ncbi:ras-related GTP binding protein [Auriculariales sp. MPI-PUGE-AT-0066]|nr:ras-related GTP binding protein [Auriculariales sp. MPI-PUGE-AT-0066]
MGTGGRFKLIVVGDQGVGKSSILHQYVDGNFAGSYVPTVGIDYAAKTVVVDGATIPLDLWDTAGQEKFRNTFTKSFYRNVHGIIMVFDLTRAATFMNLDDWFIELGKNVTWPVNMVLVGNKSDITPHQVRADAVKEFAMERGIPYFETSATDYTSVETAFLSLAMAIKDRLGLAGRADLNPAPQPATLQLPSPEQVDDQPQPRRCAC